jgi:extracellular elastinolytic metalloproteinase
MDIHDLGAIWATILNEMYWNLVDAYGFVDDIFDSSQTAGNIVAIQLMIGGMMLQPCNPTYPQALEAILQADQNYYGAIHTCEIWRAFAKRGMGINAQMVAINDYRNGFQIPHNC